MTDADPCPGDNTLAALSAGEPASASLLAHLAVCADCQEAVAASFRESADEAPRYELGEILGVGGMAVVARATDAVLQRSVALKILWGASEDDAEALLGEARMLARISHPNIVTIHDAGVLPRLDVPFISMELIEGPTLRTWLQEAHGWRDVLARFTAAAQGLASAHEHGVVHADFKPANVLLADGGRRVLVSDFGLATSLESDSEDRSAEPRGGTPRYVAPEQRRGPPGPAADQYAFGVSLHEALWGRHPHLEGPCPAAGSPHVPRRLRRIVARCIEADPARRHPSMADVVEALRSVTRSRRGPVAVVAAAVGGSVVAFVVRGADPCADATQEHTRSWSQTTRPALAEAMGQEGWERVSQPTDRWVQQWLERSEASCRAQEPPAVRACLRQQWSILGFLAERAEAGSEGVPLALSQLPPVEQCERSVESPAGSAEIAAEQIQACADPVAHGRTLVALGDSAEAIRLLDDAIETCAGSGLDALAARAYHSRAVARWNLHEVDDAFDDLSAASELAVRSGQFDVSAEALALSAQYVALHRNDFEVARQRLGMARAHAQRVDRPDVGLTLDRQEAWILFAEGRDADAAALIQGVMRREGLSKWQRATYASDLGTFLTRTDDLEGALAALEEASELGSELFGPEHPTVAGTMFNQAVLLMRIQRWGEAVDLYERAESIYAEAVGPRSRIVLYTMINRADALADAGRIDEADAALRVPREALTHELADDPDLANTVRLLSAHVVLERGEFAQARELLHDLLARWAQPGPSTASTASLHRGLGFAELGLGNDAASVRWFERSLEAADEHDPWSLGQTHFGHAQALRAGGPCTPEVRAAADRAIEVWTSHGTGPAKWKAAQVRAWLESCP